MCVGVPSALTRVHDARTKKSGKGPGYEGHTGVSVLCYDHRTARCDCALSCRTVAGGREGCAPHSLSVAQLARYGREQQYELLQLLNVASWLPPPHNELWSAAPFVLDHVAVTLVSRKEEEKKGGGHLHRGIDWNKTCPKVDCVLQFISRHVGA